MKKLYALFLVLMLFGSAAVVSCGPTEDMVPDSAELFNDDAVVDNFVNDRFDPTDPPDSTYDPFENGGN